MALWRCWLRLFLLASGLEPAGTLEDHPEEGNWLRLFLLALGLVPSSKQEDHPEGLIALGVMDKRVGRC